MEINDAVQTEEKSPVVWQDFGLILISALLLLSLESFAERFLILQVLRVILGLAFVFFIPGYCLTVAIFPRENGLGGTERVALSAGLSVVIVPILAYVLDSSPWGIHLWSILIGEYSLVALFIALALWRRSELSQAKVYAPPSIWKLRGWWNALPVVEHHIYQMLVAAILLISLIGAWVFLVPSSDQFFSEFYILGSNGFAEGFPQQVVLGDPITITVGVVNRERVDTAYQIDVWAVDNVDINKRVLVAQTDTFSLRPGEKLQQPVSWHMPWTGDNQKIELLLFANHNPAPYRQLRMWINVQEKR